MGWADTLRSAPEARSKSQPRRHLGQRVCPQDQVSCIGWAQPRHMKKKTALSTTQSLWVYGRRSTTEFEKPSQSRIVVESVAASGMMNQPRPNTELVKSSSAPLARRRSTTEFEKPLHSSPLRSPYNDVVESAAASGMMNQPWPNTELVKSSSAPSATRQRSPPARKKRPASAGSLRRKENVSCEVVQWRPLSAPSSREQKPQSNAALPNRPLPQKTPRRSRPSSAPVRRTAKSDDANASRPSARRPNRAQPRSRPSSAPSGRRADTKYEHDSLMASLSSLEMQLALSTHTRPSSAPSRRNSNTGYPNRKVFGNSAPDDVVTSEHVPQPRRLSMSSIGEDEPVPWSTEDSPVFQDTTRMSTIADMADTADELSSSGVGDLFALSVAPSSRRPSVLRDTVREARNTSYASYITHYTDPSAKTKPQDSPKEKDDPVRTLGFNTLGFSSFGFSRGQSTGTEGRSGDPDPVELANKHRFPVMEVKRKWEEFNEFDVTNKGHLTMEEFDQMVRHRCGIPEGHVLPDHLAFSEGLDMPLSKAECINFEEYLTWSMRTTFAEERLVPDPEERHLREIARTYGHTIIDVERIKVVFDGFDEDGSGCIDEQEFADLLAKLMNVSDLSDVPASLFQRYWSEVDDDGSGEVDFEEFLVWYYTKFQKQKQL